MPAIVKASDSNTAFLKGSSKGPTPMKAGPREEVCQEETVTDTRFDRWDIGRYTHGMHTIHKLVRAGSHPA